MKRTEKTDKILAKYKQYLKLEKSLSTNTVEAYLTDLDKLMAYLTLENLHPLEVTLEHLETFSAGLRDIGIHPRSQVLTVEEIDRLIESIDRSTKEGQRNRAILETLYSCGLRVSELCNLKLSDLYLNENFIKVEGKGSKQRLVPISPRAVKEINLYFPDRNQMKIKPGFEDFLFISNFGKNISRIMVFHIIKELSERIGLKKTISPHTFRHSFATHLLEGGANLRAIQCMLGHESIGTTEIYTHIDRNMLRSEIIEHHPRNIKFREEHK